MEQLFEKDYTEEIKNIVLWLDQEVIMQKEQEKNKAERAKNIAQYKATGGLSGWDASYTILKTLTESTEK